MSLLRYSKFDLLLVSQSLFTIALPVTIAIWDPDFIIWILILPVHAFLIANMINTSMHYQIHWPVFSKRRWNHFYEIILSIGGMQSTQIYKWVHLSHHRYTNDIPTLNNHHTRDPFSLFAGGKNGQPQNAWIYCFQKILFLPTNFLLCKKIKYQIPTKPKQLDNERLACFLFVLLIILINPTYGLWAWLVTYPIAGFLDYAWNYGEHWGSHDFGSDTTRNAVSIYNRWYNLLCFNEGYHQEHHYRPQVHWHDLPTVRSCLPSDRVTAKCMHIFNVPYWHHLKSLLTSR